MGSETCRLIAYYARATTLPDGAGCSHSDKFRVTACASRAQRTKSLLPLLPLGPDGVHSLPSRSCRHRPPPNYCMRGGADEVRIPKKWRGARAWWIHRGKGRLARPVPGVRRFTIRVACIPKSLAAILSNPTDQNILGSNPAQALLTASACNAALFKTGGEGGIRTRDTL